MNVRLRSLLSAAVAALLLVSAVPVRAADEADDIGTPEKAIKKFKQAVEKAPDDSQSWYNLALAHYKAKQYPDAAQAGAKAAELNAESAQTQQLLGAIAAKQGKSGDAIKFYGKARDLETAGGGKATAETILGLAGAQYDAQNWDAAIDAYKEAWKVVKEAGTGDLSAVNNQLGAAYLKKGDTDQAIKWFERNIELAPNSKATYYNLGQIYRKLAPSNSGMWTKSADMFVKAADMDKSDAIAQFFAGEALLFAGRKSECVAYLDRYLAGDPGGKKAVAKFGPAGKTEIYDSVAELKAEAAK